MYGIISIYIYIYIYCEWTEGLRQRGVAGKSERGVAGAASGAAVVGREARSAAEELLRCLLNPSAAQNIPQDSIARRVLEAASLVLNLIAFYLIVYLNKKLFREREKGGFGLQGVATLTFYQYLTSWAMLCLSGVESLPFEAGEQGKHVLLIVIFAVTDIFDMYRVIMCVRMCFRMCVTCVRNSTYY